MRPRIAFASSDRSLAEDSGIESLDTAAGGSLSSALTAIADRHRDDARVANLLGASTFMQGDFGEAAALFSRAASLAPHTSEYSYNLGISLMRGRRPRDALSAFHRSLHGDSLLRQAHYWTWGVFGSLGVADEVNALFRQALEEGASREAFPPAPAPIDLPDVTVCVADCAAPGLAVRGLRKSMAQCRFGAAKLLTSRAARCDGIETVVIDPIATIEDYSTFIMKRLGQYIETPFALVTQWDGYVVDAAAWSSEFLDYDYIGARWDDSLSDHAGKTPDQCVGNGGFSLRSDMFMRAGTDAAFTSTHPEDALLCGPYRPWLEQGYGIRFAPAGLADRFSREALVSDSTPFGFHGCYNVAMFEADPKWMRFDYLPDRLFPGS
jgi:hypothetical protein